MFGSRTMEGDNMTQRAIANPKGLTEKEISNYLDKHPETVEYLRRMAEAQAIWEKFLRLKGARTIVRDLAAGSTAEVDLNASVSRTSA